MNVQWVDDGSDFGNASGLDYVALDVKVTIAERFGATVLQGELPADIAAEQPARRDAADRAYGERASHLKTREPFAAFTISQDGGTMSGEHADGNGHTSGYRSHYWLDRIGPETVVFDLRTVPDDRIVRLAVAGPMLDVRLPAGTVSKFGGVPAGMEAVVDAYLAPVGGLDAVEGRRS